MSIFITFYVFQTKPVGEICPEIRIILSVTTTILETLVAVTPEPW